MCTKMQKSFLPIENEFIGLSLWKSKSNVLRSTAMRRNVASADAGTDTIVS